MYVYEKTKDLSNELHLEGAISLRCFSCRIENVTKLIKNSQSDQLTLYKYLKVIIIAASKFMILQDVRANFVINSSIVYFVI